MNGFLSFTRIGRVGIGPPTQSPAGATALATSASYTRVAVQIPRRRWGGSSAHRAFKVQGRPSSRGRRAMKILVILVFTRGLLSISSRSTSSGRQLDCG
jgi:hypothetical protein